MPKQYTYGKKRGLGKRKKISESEDDEHSGDDGQGQGQMPDIPITDLLKHIKKDVYLIDNHIYFKTDVTMESVDMLNKFMIGYYREYEILRETYKGYEIKPRPLHLHITSDGGDLFAGLMAVDLIKSYPVPVYTIVEGKAISAGSLIACVGHKRYMTENSYMLIHQLSSMACGPYARLKDEHENDTTLMDNIYKIYADHSNKKLTKAKLTTILQHDKFWNFETCLKYGLVDEMSSYTFSK